MPKEYFPKVKEAREFLKSKAKDIYEKYDKLIDAAIKAEKFEVAEKALAFLMDHMPPDEGVRMLDTSIDKQMVDKSNTPTIQIGIALSGQPARTIQAVPTPKALPPAHPQPAPQATVIEVPFDSNELAHHVPDLPAPSPMDDDS